MSCGIAHGQGCVVQVGLVLGSPLCCHMQQHEHDHEHDVLMRLLNPMSHARISIGCRREVSPSHVSTRTVMDTTNTILPAYLAGPRITHVVNLHHTVCSLHWRWHWLTAPSHQTHPTAPHRPQASHMHDSQAASWAFWCPAGPQRPHCSCNHSHSAAS